MEADRVGTAVLSRAEVSAAVAEAVRMTWVAREEALRALAEFQGHWPTYFRLGIRETTVERAEALARAHELRGYDAVHLACAVLWHESVGVPVILATFDRPLWEAARKLGLGAWPEAEA